MRHQAKGRREPRTTPDPVEPKFTGREGAASGGSGASLALQACDCGSPRWIRYASGQRGVDDDIGGDLEGRLVGVSLAVEPGVPLQGAADVVLGVDDRPVAVDLDALELGKSLPPPAALVYWRVLAGRSRPWSERARRRGGSARAGLVGKQLGDEPAEGGVEGGAAAGGVGEERAAAGLDVPPQARRGPPCRTTARRGRGCRSAGSRSGWGRRGRAPCG